MSAFRADAGRRQEAEALMSAAIHLYGRLDVLLNYAAICPFRDLWKITDEVWRETIRRCLYLQIDGGLKVRP